MITAILARAPWLRTAFAALPWVLAGLGMAAGLYYRGEWQECRAAAALDAAKAAERVAAAKAADEAFTRTLEVQLRPVVAAIQDQKHETAIALSKVRSDPNCASTPAARAFDSGVRPSGEAGPR